MYTHQRRNTRPFSLKFFWSVTVASMKPKIVAREVGTRVTSLLSMMAQKCVDRVGSSTELQKLNDEETDCHEPATQEASEAGEQLKELSRVRGIMAALTMLICYTFLNVAISMIAPFYPIVVSFICHRMLEVLV